MRDPIGNADGMNLYQYTRSNPTKLRDWSGLEATSSQLGDCYCGPDVTDFLVNLINYAGKWRAKQGAISRAEGFAWLQANGQNLDWWSTRGPYKTKNCPSGDQCAHTYWLCGECVHDNWIGNFMYGYLGRLLSMPDWIMNAGGNYVQRSGPGDDPNLTYSDPPWDTAGYGLGRLMFDELTKPKGEREVCRILHSDMDLWRVANNTGALPPKSGIDWYGWRIYDTTPRWPTPRATKYKSKCRKCPENLPSAVTNTVPGGKFGTSFPDVGGV